MKKLTSKKSLEFLTIMTTVIGTMVGAGIYVKNDNQNGHVLGLIQNPIGALILWAIVGIIVMAAIMVFIEIASSTVKHGNGTVSNWTRMFLNRRTASAVSIYYIFVYLPVNYAFFSTLILQYILTAAGNPISDKGTLIGMYIAIGMIFILCFGMLNSFAREKGKGLQIVGTFVKFIPLFIVLLALFIPDKTWGVIFNNSGNIDNGGNTWSTSLEDLDGMKMLSGFAPILFAFNGFIYAANMQAETKNKDVVAKGIFVGVLFTTIFYILISLALFMGSKDGSVVGFFEYLFNGFKSGEASGSSHDVAIVFSNVILAIVCLMGLNGYTLTGANFFNTDANNGILFSNNKYIKQTTSGVVQMILGIIFLIPLVIASVLTSDTNKATVYMDLAGNAGAIIGFTTYTLLLLLAIINRFTRKIEVKKINNVLFWICAPFSFLALAFICVYSFLDFFGAINGVNIENILSMGISIVIIFILWVVNEILLWKRPFKMNEIQKQKDLLIKSQNVKINKVNLFIKINNKKQ